MGTDNLSYRAFIVEETKGKLKPESSFVVL